MLSVGTLYWLLIKGSVTRKVFITDTAKYKRSQGQTILKKTAWNGLQLWFLKNLLAYTILKVHFQRCIQRLILYLGDIFVWHEAVIVSFTSNFLSSIKNKDAQLALLTTAGMNQTAYKGNKGERGRVPLHVGCREPWHSLLYTLLSFS